MMRSDNPLLDYYDLYGIRTTTLNSGALFCFDLTLVLWVLDYVAYVPIFKSGMEKVLVIRYFHRYSVCAITLSQRHGISLGLPRFLFVISFILTALISDISLAERRMVMISIGFTLLELEKVPRTKISPITPSCPYKISLPLSSQAMALLATSLRSNPFAHLFMMTMMIASINVSIFVFEKFPAHMERYLVNRSSIITLNFGLDSNDWSQLHIDCVCEIVNRLPSFEDVMAATGISRTWRSACFATTITMPHQLPWLMLPETPDTHRRRFLSLLNKKRYQLPVSNALCGKRCWGSQHNWVVALGPDYRAHIVPLVKGEPIALPPLDTIRGDAPEEWFRLAHKFILFKDPSHDHELSFLVFAIFGPVNCLAFARVGEGATLNDEWVIVTSPDNLKFKDVARLNDKIYGVCDEGTLVRVELDAPLLPEVQVIASYQPDVPEPRQLYLVESLGKLYMVFRYGDLIPSERRHVTTSFLVYTFNFSALAFEGVRDFEGHAFFVGDGNSWSIPASTIPGLTNRIYFTDDHWDRPIYPAGANGGPPPHSRPILVTPPIRLD